MDMTLQPEALGALFELSRDAVLGIDEKGLIAFANPAAAALLGAGAGMPAEGVVPGYVLEDPADRFVSSTDLKDGRKASLTVTRQNGFTLVSYSLHATAADAALYFPEKALSDWSSSLMDARMAIDGLASHMRRNADGPTKAYFNALYRDYYRMKRACYHMNTAASIASGSLHFAPRAVDLKKLCGELCSTVALFAESLDVAVSFQAGNGPYVTEADPELLETMLLNLITNSLSQTSPGGTVDMELSRQGKRFVIALRDTGAGIGPEKLSGLFSGDAGRDLRDTGSGLGFLIARSIVERHEGAIVLESRPGQGTSIRISIPYREGGSPELRAPDPGYRNDGMDRVLTELSPIIDTKYYNNRLFD